MKINACFIAFLLSFTSVFSQNIALLKFTTASSSIGNNQADYTVDGNQSTRWESDYSDP